MAEFAKVLSYVTVAKKNIENHFDKQLLLVLLFGEYDMYGNVHTHSIYH